MNKILAIFFTSIMIYSSCNDPVTTTCYSIINNSNHNIELEMYANCGVQVDSVFLTNNQQKTFIEQNIAGIIFPFDKLDSIKVSYDDTISIMHYIYEEQISSRSLLLKESYAGGKISEYEYKYEYIFTETDYNEALEHQ